MKICFATEVTYPNYVNRIKISSLNSFFEKGLDKLGLKYYISTNLPNEFSEYKDNDSVLVFDVEELRKDNISSKEQELLPEDPKGLYPSRYPWNLRRFIIEQAAKDGFDYIIYIDADNLIHSHVDGNTFINVLNTNYEPNTVQTSSAVFKYINKVPDDVFCHHDKHIQHFGFNFTTEQYDTLDGPIQIFIGQTNQDVLRLISNWHMLTKFGYESEFGYKNNKHGNLSFVIPMSGFTLKWKPYPFFQNHRPEDRY
jgi:hypothetical protein